MSELPALPDIPPALRFLSTTLTRGKELEIADPVISYYCKLHAAQQILAQNLHKTDAEAADFVGALLDQVEFMKSNSPKLTSEYGQSILNDETVASAYIESFAMNVFAKADKDVYDKTTTKTTITKFMAASTFFDLLNVFQNDSLGAEVDGAQQVNGLDTDVKEKIKYCKWQAARIAKAYKQGIDPNEYDPPEPKKDEEQEVNDLLSQTAKEVELENEEALTSKDETEPSAQAQNEDNDKDDDINPEDYFIPPPSTIPTHQPNSGPADSSTESSTSSFQPDNLSAAGITIYKPSTPVHIPVSSQPTHQKSQGVTRQQAQIILDESELIATVQKRCKFAISALTYEDMKTALQQINEARDLLMKNVPEKDLY